MNTTLLETRQRVFGPGYVGASLARVQLDDKIAAAIRSYIKQPKHWLVIFGPPGTGKTYLASALIESFRLDNLRNFHWLDLLGQIKSKIKVGRDASLELAYYSDYEVFIVDDIACGTNTEWQESMLLELLEHRESRITIFTTNLSYSDFAEKFHPRLVSRLFDKRNTLVDMTGCTDYRTEGRPKHKEPVLNA